MDQDVTWYGARPRPRRLCVRWGPRSPLPKSGDGAPKFSAHVYCGQTAGWMKLGTEVGLSPGDFVLDGDPAQPSPKGALPSPIFGPFLLWPNGCMHQDATWYGGRPQSRGLCVTSGPSLPPNFRPMFIIVISLEHCTMHSRYWFIQVQVQVLVFYVIRKKFKFNRTQSVPI